MRNQIKKIIPEKILTMLNHLRLLGIKEYFLSRFKRRKIIKNLRDKNKDNAVTIIIAIKNRRTNRLEKVIDSVKQQSYPSKLIKIVLIDYDSEEEFSKEYSFFCKKEKIKYILAKKAPIWNRSHAYNIGIKEANSKFVFILDADIILSKNYIKKAIDEGIDIQKYFEPVNIMNLTNNILGPSSKNLREKVEMARNMQRERYKNVKNVRCNAFMTPELINEYCVLDEQSKNIFKNAYEKFRYSARTYHKFLRVARTFADMEGSEKINRSHIIKALMCREIEKEQATMVVV